MDAGSWFNRNLALIRNIEREFLSSSDQAAIHPFFAEKHRGAKLVEHFRIQVALAAVIWSLAILEHLAFRMPAFCSDGARGKALLLLPYVLSTVLFAGLAWLRGHYRAKHESLVSQSPGPPLRDGE